MPADPTQALIDAPEPAERTYLEPLLPLGGLPFSPASECPHWCRRCSGSGVDPAAGLDEAGEPVECPDCGGTGDSWPDDPFVCVICHRSGKDGGRAVPFGVEPMPPDRRPAPRPEPAEAPAERIPAVAAKTSGKMARRRARKRAEAAATGEAA